MLTAILLNHVYHLLLISLSQYIGSISFLSLTVSKGKRQDRKKIWNTLGGGVIFFRFSIKSGGILPNSSRKQRKKGPVWKIRYFFFYLEDFPNPKECNSSQFDFGNFKGICIIQMFRTDPKDPKQAIL